MGMIVEKLFRLMADKQASDIFISAGAPIHIKIQGQTLPINQQVMQPAMIERMTREIMSPEQHETYEAGKEMNLSFGMQDLGNFRVNCFYQRNSPAIVVRYVLGDIPSLESLGMPPILADIVMEQRGLVLVVGATGSGKSTTVAAMLDYRNTHRTGHILTVEDPIEYLFKHKKSVINQRAIGVDTISWAEALRNAMRQAPDCIMIGEIRDRETMAAALAYAQTGHLCVATLHANNSYHVLNRIINFFPLENRNALCLDLSASLRCVVSQRLVRKPNGQRTPAVEILLNTRNISDLIARGEVNAIQEAMEQSLAPGCQTYEEDLFRLFKERVITLEEALANADSPTNLSWLVNNSQIEANLPPKSSPATPTAPPADRAPVDFEASLTGASFSEMSLHIQDHGHN